MAQNKPKELEKAKLKPTISSTESEQPMVPALFIRGGISKDSLVQVEKCAKKSTSDHLYIVIKSLGGDAYSAVRIIKHLRSKYSELSIVIPDYCYSAATLMSLGANTIFVAPEGYIGPIDKPMEHDASAEQISALDMTQSITNIFSLASTNAKGAYVEIRENYPDRISKKDALQISWESSVKLLSPLMEKIDPVLLQKAFRDLRIGMLSGLDLLKSHMPDFYSRLSIVQSLVNNYPSHGYAIFRDEMLSLGLPVKNLENCKDEAALIRFHRDDGKPDIFFLENIYAKETNEN